MVFFEFSRLSVGWVFYLLSLMGMVFFLLCFLPIYYALASLKTKLADLGELEKPCFPLGMRSQMCEAV